MLFHSRPPKAREGLFDATQNVLPQGEDFSIEKRLIPISIDIALGNLFFLLNTKERAHHDYYNSFLKLKNRLENLSDKPLSECSVLDIGCGSTFPNVILLNDCCKYVAGIDILGCFYNDELLKGTLKNFKAPVSLLKYLIGKNYHKQLFKLNRHKTDTRKFDLFSYDGYHLPFKDNSFDIVISTAVLEHVSDLEKVSNEIARVLKTNGIIDMLWHSYYSFSGNHLPDSVNRKHPWGHLTGDLIPESSLNKVLPDKLESFFEKCFTIIQHTKADVNHNLYGDLNFQWEAESYLTDEILSKISYPKQLLLTRCFLLQAKKNNPITISMRSE